MEGQQEQKDAEAQKNILDHAKQNWYKCREDNTWIQVTMSSDTRGWQHTDRCFSFRRKRRNPPTWEWMNWKQNGLYQSTSDDNRPNDIGIWRILPNFTSRNHHFKTENHGNYKATSSAAQRRDISFLGCTCIPESPAAIIWEWMNSLRAAPNKLNKEPWTKQLSYWQYIQ